MSLLKDAIGTFTDLKSALSTSYGREVLGQEAVSITKAGPVLRRLMAARGEADESLVKQLDENARRAPNALAIEMGDERYTWRGLQERSSRLAFVLASRGVRAGDVVALVGMNSPTYVAAVFAIGRLGATAALINHHLDGAALSHAVAVSGAKQALVEERFLETVAARTTHAGQQVALMSYGTEAFEELLAAAPRALVPRVPTRADADYVYIYTSGTTGLPKPCRVTHARSVVGGQAFGTLLFEFRAGDKLYCVLPLYHSSALLLGLGSCVMTGTPIALRESFSATQFWRDVRRYRATAMLYIGELCRYLINTPPCEEERDGRIRVALGNGLRADVWPEFASRFKIENIREFYGATEGPGAIFNLHNRVGSVGRVPARRFARFRLALFDVEREEFIRDAQGFCIEAAPGQTGQLIARLDEQPKSALTEFRGYTDAAATSKKLMRDVFVKGDYYYLSGDLMRRDEDDFFYFVDRVGDTYRWKGENVSTAEVAEVVARAPGVTGATVVGVPVPGTEGQAGLAAITVAEPFDATAFWAAVQELPGYAQPRFVRLMPQLETTGTFKIKKSDLRSAGLNPAHGVGPIYVRTEEAYVTFEDELFARLERGELRL